jgi:hypothetical protein
MACIHLFPYSTADFLLFFATPPQPLPKPKSRPCAGCAGLPRDKWPAIIFVNRPTVGPSVCFSQGTLTHTHKRHLECCARACARHKDSRRPDNWNSMTDPRAREMGFQLSFKFHYTTLRFLCEMRAGPFGKSILQRVLNIIL